MFPKVENFFSIVSTAIDSQSSKKTSNESVEAAANILDVTEEIGRTMASTLGKWSFGSWIINDRRSSLSLRRYLTNYCLRETLCFIWFSPVWLDDIILMLFSVYNNI